MLRIASKQAKKSPFIQHRVGAVIVKGHRVLSTGYNEIRYTKELRKNTVHAEEAAILKLLRAKRLTDLVGSDLYVSRFTRGGRIGLSRPCVTCQSLIHSVGINKVYYTNDDGTVGEYKCGV